MSSRKRRDLEPRGVGVDAITSNRSYHKARTQADAYTEMTIPGVVTGTPTVGPGPGSGPNPALVPLLSGGTGRYKLGSCAASVGRIMG